MPRPIPIAVDDVNLLLLDLLLPPFPLQPELFSQEVLLSVPVSVRQKFRLYIWVHTKPFLFGLKQNLFTFSFFFHVSDNLFQFFFSGAFIHILIFIFLLIFIGVERESLKLFLFLCLLFCFSFQLGFRLILLLLLHPNKLLLSLLHHSLLRSLHLVDGDQPDLRKTGMSIPTRAMLGDVISCLSKIHNDTYSGCTNFPCNRVVGGRELVGDVLHLQVVR